MKICEERAGSQNALARKAGIAQSTIRGYTSRNAEPPRDVLVQLAEAAGVSTLWLATGEGPVEPKQAVAFLTTGISDPSEGLDEIAAVAAKAYSVPIEFARLRLSGSVELKALRGALGEWSRFRPVPVIDAYLKPAEWPIWGVLSRDDIKVAAPHAMPETIALYHIATKNLAPRFAAGDWAIVDLSAKLSTGTYCVVAVGGRVIEVRDIKPEPSGAVQLSGQKDLDGNWSSQIINNTENLKKKFRILGRLVGAIRFAGKEAAATS